MEEIWKDIKGYEGYYMISNLGRVKSLERDVYRKDGKISYHKKEKIKIPKTTTDGYNAVVLSVNGISKTFSVHFLVADAFLSDKPNSTVKYEINHIDTNRKNNCANNLEWVSHLKNIQHSVTLGHYNCHSGNNNGRCVPIAVYTLDNKFIKRFDYIVECAKWLKENNPKIRSNDYYQIADHIAQRTKDGLPCYGYIFITEK